MLHRPAGSAGVGGSFGILVSYRTLAVEAARKPRIGPKRDCCSTVLHRTPQWQWPNQATTHATAGHRHPEVGTHQESEDVALTTPTHDQESEDVYVVDR